METEQPTSSQEALRTLLAQGAILHEQLGPYCQERIGLLKLEGQLAVHSLVVGTRWLVAAMIAAMTCWLGLNLAAIAALQEAGMSWSFAILTVSVADALLACLAHYLATRCLDDMRFKRSRALWHHDHAPR
ncbi:hypothetical protein [Chitinimonas sp.]|uniref:hypothetical protein n=1 Tax=Chitinimonas sp. TaxID=1934313 RepID=UPI002F92F8B9